MGSSTLCLEGCIEGEVEGGAVEAALVVSRQAEGGDAFSGGRGQQRRERR